MEVRIAAAVVLPFDSISPEEQASQDAVLELDQYVETDARLVVKEGAMVRSPETGIKQDRLTVVVAQRFFMP